MLTDYISAKSVAFLLAQLADTNKQTIDFAAEQDLLGELSSTNRNSIIKSLQKLYEQKTVGQICYALGVAVTLEEVMRAIHDEFKHVLPYDSVTSGLFEKNFTVLRTRQQLPLNENSKLKLGYATTMSNSSLQNVLNSKTPRIINNLPEYYKNRPTSKSTRLAVEDGVKSSMTCPLYLNDTPVGFLFFNSLNFDTYTEKHSEFLQSMSNILASAVFKGYTGKQQTDMLDKIVHGIKPLVPLDTHDGTVGVLNTKTILEELEHLLKTSQTLPAENSTQIGVMLVQIENFDVVHKKYGHQASGQILQEAADCISDQLRSSDQVGRYDISKFLVLAQALNDEELLDLANRIRVAVQENDTNHMGLLVKIGITPVLAKTTSNINSVLSKTQIALNTAVFSQKNPVILSTELPY